MYKNIQSIFVHLENVSIPLFIVSVILLSPAVSMVSLDPSSSLTVFKLGIVAIKSSLKCTTTGSNFKFATCSYFCKPPLVCVVKLSAEEHSRMSVTKVGLFDTLHVEHVSSSFQLLGIWNIGPCARRCPMCMADTPFPAAYGHWSR